MTKKKTSNAKARQLVQKRESFVGSNTYGEWVGNTYVVYSYGPHWPMFIWVNSQWYQNEERYSVTTSKHSSQVHPHMVTLKVSLQKMQSLIREAQCEQ